MAEASRMIIALATERPGDAIWNRIKVLRDEIFAAPVAVQFMYYGAEGPGQNRRPCVSTRWVTDGNDWARLVRHANASCVCGCYVLTDAMLQHALREAQAAPVQAVILIGELHGGRPDDAVAIAGRLRNLGARVFCFQTDHSVATERAFSRIAEAVGGAFRQIDPHTEGLTERMSGMVEAISHYAVGGKAALEARDDESANLLLEQMAAADRTLARSRS